MDVVLREALELYTKFLWFYIFVVGLLDTDSSVVMNFPDQVEEKHG